MAERLTLPVLPLREVVLFPGVTAPIGAGRPATLRAIEAALATPDRLVFAVSQRQNVENVAPDVLYTIGTIARIGQLQRGLSGMQLLLNGERRGIAIHYSDKEGYLQAIVREAEEMSPLNPDDPAFVALHRESRVRAAELGRSPVCRTRWFSRSWPESTSPASSPISWLGISISRPQAADTA